MLAFLPPNPRQIIDVGCGEGYFGEAVKARFPECETWGVEPVAQAAKRAAGRNDHVINTTLTDATGLPDRFFDAVTMNDVLEHLAWPEPTLAVGRRILKPDGNLILSLPNIAHYQIIRDLALRNEWEYGDNGILDRTHFRFYTAKSATRMLEQNGFKVEKVAGLNPTPSKWYYRFIFAMAPKYFHWMPFTQFAVVARPVS